MLTAVSSIHAISKDDWDRLANPPGAEYNPLVSHDFFRCLEDSGCAVAQEGWAARHLLLEEDGRIAGIVPCFRKTHSYGEYVFDHGWADAFSRAGGRYYPKLQVSVPFSPVTGPRLFAPDLQTRQTLSQGLIALCAQEKASSVHITFLPERDWLEIGDGGDWLKRTDIQFHWLNQGYESFADFLASLSSQKRKNIRKERASPANAGITMHALTGTDIQERHWDAFYEFYMDTSSRKWGQPYLNRAFFSLIGQSMSGHILLVMAERQGQLIAGALNFIGSHALYGRNWGAIEHHPNLHFETCYYQAIEFAISRKLARVEAGAQGAHKLARGYLPHKTYSLHYLAHPGLSRAVANYLEAERDGVDQEQQALATHSPFRHETDD